MNIYEQMMKEYEKYNPYTATGVDLDNIAKYVGLEREMTEWLESDREFRIKILETLHKYFKEDLTLEDWLCFTNNLNLTNGVHTNGRDSFLFPVWTD